MDRIERIYRIHALLKDGRAHPFARIQEAVGASRATIKRDLAYMRDFMSAPILYERSRNGYFYDPEAPAFELPGLWFNASELYALLAMQQLLEQVEPGLLGGQIGPLKARIGKLLEQSGQPAEVVASRIRLQPVATRPLDEPLFLLASRAVLAARRMEIDYHGRMKDRRQRRTIHPHCLLHYRGNWYLVAWCEQARGLRNFALDRVRDGHLLEAPARLVEQRTLDRHLGASFGIFAGEARDWAVLRFSAESARWVADERWHPDQIGRFVGDRYELQIPYSDPRELIMEILKYGPEVEVLAPASLRREVAARLRRAAALYATADDR